MFPFQETGRAFETGSGGPSERRKGEGAGKEEKNRRENGTNGEEKRYGWLSFNKCSAH